MLPLRKPVKPKPFLPQTIPVNSEPYEDVKSKSKSYKRDQATPIKGAVIATKDLNLL